MTTALLALAFATTTGGDAAPSCPGPVLVASLPSDGAVGVGIDQPLHLLYDGGHCTYQFDYTLTDPLGVVAEGQVADARYEGNGRHLVLTPELAADTEYTLVLVPIDGEETQLTFTTGAAPYEVPPLDALQLSIEVVDVLRADRRFLDVLVDATVDAPPELLLHLSDDPEYTRLLTTTGDGASTETLQVFTDTGEVCIYASAEDALGNRSEWVEVCEEVSAPVDDDEEDEDADEEEPYKPSRCQSAPAPVGLLALVLPLLGLRRR